MASAESKFEDKNRCNGFSENVCCKKLNFCYRDVKKKVLLLRSIKALYEILYIYLRKEYY